MPFTHVAIPVSDIDASKEFYTTLLKPLGYKVLLDFKVAVGFGTGENADFWIGRATDGQKFTETSPKAHIAFVAETKDDVQAFYDAGLKAGGVDNGAPGDRPQYGPNYYACFVYDLDGYNVEAQLVTK